jgi:hypothetical protein
MKSKSIIKSLEMRVLFHFQWIKAHEGIEGNERANILAKEAAELDMNQSINIYNLFPLSFAKRYLRAVTANEWQNMWITTNKASQTKQFFLTVNGRFSNKHLKLNFIITQFLFRYGHFNLLYLLKVTLKIMIYLI